MTVILSLQVWSNYNLFNRKLNKSLFKQKILSTDFSCVMQTEKKTLIGSRLSLVFTVTYHNSISYPIITITVTYHYKFMTISITCFLASPRRLVLTSIYNFNHCNVTFQVITYHDHFVTIHGLSSSLSFL